MRTNLALGAGGILAAASLVLATPASAATPAETLHLGPQSASGCTTNAQDTRTSCIDVEGSGIMVDHVTASQNYSGYAIHCATPRLYRNGSLYATGRKQCGPVSLKWTFPLKLQFRDNTQLCTQWSDTDLRPCETVHY